MQHKSAPKCSNSVALRLERLRLQKQLTWADLAETLRVSTSMIHQVRAGKRNLSPKALYRLEKLEESLSDARANLALAANYEVQQLVKGGTSPADLSKAFEAAVAQATMDQLVSAQVYLSGRQNDSTLVGPLCRYALCAIFVEMARRVEKKA